KSTGDGGILPGSEQGQREECAGRGEAEQRREQFVSVTNLSDFVVPTAVKDCRRNDENGGVDKKRRAQGGGGVNLRVAQGFALALGRASVVARLHHGRVHVQIV